jgi:hypothetical protein
VNRIYFLLGPADPPYQDSSTLMASRNGKKSGDIVLKGILPILNFVTSDPKLRKICTWFMIGTHEIKIPRNVPVTLFNLVGDADSSTTMLRQIQAIAGKVQLRRCLNPPVKVFRTTREALPKTLAGIAGCRVPAVRAVKAANFTELESACRDFGKWPLILRARGFHAGENMTLLHGPEDLGALRDLKWRHDDLLLIEFVDTRRDDGLYMKNRVVMIDGEPYMRHAIVSNRWSIHSDSRSDLMDDNLELCAQEEAHLSYMKDTGLQQLRGTLNDIQDRIGLDIFGIDFALVEGGMVIFEANACMNFLKHDGGEDNRYAYLEPYIKVLQRAVRKILLRA